MHTLYFISGVGVGAALFAILALLIVKRAQTKGYKEAANNQAEASALLKERNELTQSTNHFLEGIYQALLNK